MDIHLRNFGRFRIRARAHSVHPQIFGAGVGLCVGGGVGVGVGVGAAVVAHHAMITPAITISRATATMMISLRLKQPRGVFVLPPPRSASPRSFCGGAFDCRLCATFTGFSLARSARSVSATWACTISLCWALNRN